MDQHEKIKYLTADLMAARKKIQVLNITLNSIATYADIQSSVTKDSANLLKRISHMADQAANMDSIKTTGDKK